MQVSLFVFNLCQVISSNIKTELHRIFSLIQEWCAGVFLLLLQSLISTFLLWFLQALGGHYISFSISTASHFLYISIYFLYIYLTHFTQIYKITELGWDSWTLFFKNRWGKYRNNNETGKPDVQRRDFGTLNLQQSDIITKVKGQLSVILAFWTWCG